MKIVFTREASDDLDHIFAWIAQDNPSMAYAMLDRLYARISQLLTPGFTGMGRTGRVARTRELIEPPYVIAYATRPKRKEIVILGIFHARRGH